MCRSYQEIIIIFMTSCQNSYSEDPTLLVLIENCLLRTLKSAEVILKPSLVDTIRIKIEEIADTSTVIQAIETFLFNLISDLQHHIQAIKIDVNKQDYQNLEASIQRSQAEIRKHIRLEQQLKIYLDGLEQKVEALEKELKIQSQKYITLFESTKVLDLEKKDLNRRIKVLESKINAKSIEKQEKMLSHKVSKILSQPSFYDYENQQASAYRIYHDRPRINRRKNSQKSSALLYEQNRKKSNPKNIQGQISVSLAESPNKVLASNIGPKQLTKTIHFHDNFKKHSRKLMKFTNDEKIRASKKQARCNSVCH